MSEKREYKDYEIIAAQHLYDYCHSDVAKQRRRTEANKLLGKLFANVGLCVYQSSRHAQLQKARREIISASMNIPQLPNKSGGIVLKPSTQGETKEGEYVISKPNFPYSD